MGRIAWGVVGWLAAVLPLLGVNIAGYANVFDAEAAVAMGAAALLGGILLGALVTGLLAGRPSARRAGGAAATLPAGVVAAVLYTVSLIIVVEVAIRTDAAPVIVAEHPIRIAGAIICLGAILLGVSLIVGMLAGRLSGSRETQTQPAPQYVAPAAQRPPSQQSRPRYAASSSEPARGYPDRGDPRNYRDPRDPGGYRDYGDDRRDSGANDRQGRGYTTYNEYNGYDQRQHAPQRNGGAPSRPQTQAPSGPSARYGGRSSQGGGRDDDWRDPRR